MASNKVTLVGCGDGRSVGFVVGWEGNPEGDALGLAEGLAEGVAVGSADGDADGDSDGLLEGDGDGLLVGDSAVVGTLVAFEGDTLGLDVGKMLGLVLGLALGLHEGDVVGCSVEHKPNPNRVAASHATSAPSQTRVPRQPAFSQQSFPVGQASQLPPQSMSLSSPSWKPLVQLSPVGDLDGLALGEPVG